MNRFERRSLRTLAVIVAVGLVAIIAAAEFTLARLRPATVLSAYESVPRPQRHIVLREWLPDATFIVAPPEIRHRSPGGAVQDVYELAIDEDGFIEPSRVHDAPELTVAFLGGSTTECLFVTPDVRFPYLVGRLLETRTGRTVNSLNAGKSGNNTMHSLLALTAKVLPRRPHFVVLMHNVNDLGVLARYGSYWNDDSDVALVRTRKRSVETAVRDVRDLAMPRTYRALRRGVRRLGDAVSALLGRAEAAEDARAEDARADDARAGADAWADDFESALRQFAATARAWGARPVLMTQVAGEAGAETPGAAAGDYLAEGTLRRRGFTAASFESTHAYFNAVIRHVARTEGALLIDPAAAEWDADDLYDRLHFTDNGSRKMAALIADALAAAIASDPALSAM